MRLTAAEREMKGPKNSLKDNSLGVKRLAKDKKKEVYKKTISLQIKISLPLGPVTNFFLNLDL